MGILDELTKAAGLGAPGQGTAGQPDLAAALGSLLDPKDASVGGNNGLSELLESFAAGGLGEQVSSWLSQGANLPVDANQIAGALNVDTLRQFAAQAGIDFDQAAASLAEVLPGLVDKLSPQGGAPDAGALSDLLGRLGQR